MFENPPTLTFIFQTIAVVLILSAIGIYFVKRYEKKEK
ncbi:hypothetical protein AAX26_00472 [Aliarcobacter thereius]|uniref:Uncharacterized protein n=2 Tax=Aliarcobacter thereius TaxID=544718 RepID=A0A1C0B8Z8_9BACT|nr:hypothetical protein AAX26_00472 [Aliarcobacter thereius]OCL92273.1 hypothetical protein AAX25_01011 [Aliarcobacter thereius]OCL94631.1 hypothetical protein AA347_00062 [Aliarcobacter thereius LMG 24486]OCM00077.1 hypothetical protein AAX29_00067 [Aliarcobacter thereius]